MDPGVSDRLGGVYHDKVYATLEIRACSRNYQCTPAGKINSIDSRVHGNRTLYAEARSYHYKLYLHTRVITYRLILVSLQASGGRGWTPRHYPHVTFSNPGVDYLSLSPLESTAGSTKQTQIMQGTEMPPLTDGFAASQVRPHIYMMQPSSSFFFYAYAKWKARIYCDSWTGLGK